MSFKKGEAMTATFSDPDYYLWGGTMVCGDDGKREHAFNIRVPLKAAENAQP
jgi:hypothetical protein